MENEENKLKSLLTGQEFETDASQMQRLEWAKECARSYAELTNGIAVLSDLQQDVCHIYSGLFGRSFGILEYQMNRKSAFEHEVFDNISEEDILTRHILELRFFHFLKSLPPAEKTRYYAVCMVHFQRNELPSLPVLHTTRYLLCHANGSVWLGLCTYMPFLQTRDETFGGIVNICTGQTVQPEMYEQNDFQLLSKRQQEVLSLLAKGMGSKQVADKLCLSVHTVNRHRQDILSALHATNIAAAIKIGTYLNLV